MSGVTIYRKLLNIQKVLNVPKNQFNKFGNYYYRNAEDILNAIKPLLWEQDCTAFFREDYIEQIGDRYYLVATFDFVDVDTGEKITVQARAREEEVKKGMDGSQITGAASSYARKYALNGIFLIDDAKDADSNEYSQQNKQQQGKKQQGQPNQQPQQQIILITNQQHDELLAKINHLAQVKGVEFDQVANFLLGKYKVGNFREIPSMSYELVSNNIDNMIKKAEGKINDA
ncbi:ERF family protein [Streptococcus fryi]